MRSSRMIAMDNVPARMGRKPIPIDWEEVDKLCQIQCTQEEIASFFNCTIDTLNNRCKSENGKTFSEYSREKRECGKCSLRRAQWKLAQKGNATLLIWLGKNWLGQSDGDARTTEPPKENPEFPPMTREQARELLTREQGATA